MKGVILKSLLLVVALFLGILTGGYMALIRGVPKIEEIRGYMPAASTKIYADDDTLIGEFKVDKGVHVRIDRIPETLLRAVISVEDARFWLHKGVDYIAVVRALTRDIQARRIKEGASTITQQLAKVVFLSPEKTVMRKLKEATLAFRIEKNLSKEEIIELYLNRIYFGHGAYGIEMAARTYFGKSISDVSLAEASMLAGLVKAPNRYSPYVNMKRAKDRQRIVLYRMKEEGYITEEQADEAFSEPLYLSTVKNRTYKPNYFLEHVRKYLEDRYGAAMTYKGGLEVHTTLNSSVQLAAVSALRRGLERLDKRQGFRGAVDHRDIDADGDPDDGEVYEKVVMKKGERLTATVMSVTPEEAKVKVRNVTGTLYAADAKWAARVLDARGNLVVRHKKFNVTKILKPGDVVHVRVKVVSDTAPVFTLDQEPDVQGALVAIEPATGYVRAIVGGYDFNKSEYNRAIQARRQAGSGFKPIVFATAMDNGYTPASIIIDEPLIYESEKYGDWEPVNYDEKYHGATRLREGLIHSRNIVTVKLVEELGIGKIIKFARRLGFKGPFQRDLTLGLGSLSVSPLEITSAFSVFANEGVLMEPIPVKYVIDADGNVLENNTPRGKRAISSQTAFLTTSMLEDVVKHGTGWRARALRRPVAGKTGTTNDYRDAWFIGYTRELATGVWVGYDNVRTLGDEETGSRAAAPVWVDFMKRALKEIAPFDGRSGEKRPFPIPEGIVTGVIDPVTGLLATSETESIVEFFREGTVPTVYSTSFYRELILKQKEALRKVKRERKKRSREQ